MKPTVSSKLLEFHRDGKAYIQGFIDGKFRKMEIPIKPFAYAERRALEYLQKEGRVIELDDAYLGDDRRPAVKFVCRDIDAYYYVRKKLRSLGFRVYETDIKLSDKLIYYQHFDVKYTTDNVVFLDIEVDDSNGFPSEPGKYQILAVAVVDYSGNKKWFYIGDYEDETKMLKHLELYLMSNKKTIIVGYNVQFDYTHLVERYKELGIRSIYLEVVETIDMYEHIRGNFKGLPDYKLDTVAQHFLGVGKVKRTKRVSEMTRDELYEYNMRDVELLPQIDKITNTVGEVIQVANTTKIPISYLNATKLWDILIAREMHKAGFVMRPKTKYGEHVRYTGAMVKEPKMGLYRNVVYLDVESLYPNIMMHYKVDILDFRGAFLPRLLEQYFALRKFFKKKRNEYEPGTNEYLKYDLLQKVYKILINSAYGIFGNPGFRYYDPKKAEFITLTGQKTLGKVIGYIENDIGYKVAYADTDGTFIQVPHDIDEDGAEVLANIVNDYIKPFRVKVEAVFDKMLIPESSTKKGVGSKKRYIYLTKDGKLKWTGIELVRGDVPQVTKTVMRHIIEMIMLEDASYGQVKQYLAQVYSDLMNGKYDDQLIITKGVKEDPNEYATTGPHIRAYKMAYKKGYRPIDGTISFVFGNGDVVPIINEDDLKNVNFDYNTYWEVYIKAPVDRIIKAAYQFQTGLGKWMNINGH